MSTRRPLLTAVAAGTVLCALSFVPSAHAEDGPRAAPPAHARQHTTAPRDSAAPGDDAPGGPARTAPLP
ncbi:hypothetical protein [Streptomyces sp. NBC_01387]|uniref:hypothetical protein n=1 Tax=Streptomyces sp. NBC_01387 TaxID=2903849 RepID=UPI003867B6B2